LRFFTVVVCLVDLAVEVSWGASVALQLNENEVIEALKSRHLLPTQNLGHNPLYILHHSCPTWVIDPLFLLVQ